MPKWQNEYTLLIPETNSNGKEDDDSYLKIWRVKPRCWGWNAIYKSWVLKCGDSPSKRKAQLAARKAYNKLKALYKDVR